MATTRATTRTITNAWVDRTLPDIFYEEPEPPEDALVQERAVHRIIHLLWELYEDRSDVFISGAFYVAYDATDGNRRVQPDCFIAFDVDAETIRQNLPNYWVWEVGKAPDLVIEVASPSTAANDLGHKRDLYAQLGIPEYWRFDSTGGELYSQPLAGERLVEGEYQSFDLQIGDDNSVKAYSELLDVDFYWDGQEFDVLDSVTGKTIDKREVAEARADAELEARLVEREARLAAEARERALLEEIERLRGRQSGR